MNTIKTIICALIIFSVSFAFAEDDDYSSNYSSSSSYSSRSGDFGVGLASASRLLVTSETALTGIFELNRKSFLQGYFVLTSSDPNVYGLGATYKHTISGDNETGFHIGGGIGLGQWAEDRSFFRINGLAGVHFTVSKKVAIHMDGGITITQDETAGGNESSQFLIGGSSSLFGLSLVYML